MTDVFVNVKSGYKCTLIKIRTGIDVTLELMRE